MKWNLDSLQLPDSIAELYPNKTRLFEQMRAFEEDLSFFMKAKLLNVKEDLLATNTKVKRMMKIHATVEPSLQNQGKSSWKLRLEGKIQNSGIKEESTSTRFLELFEKVRIEFNTADPEA